MAKTTSKLPLEPAAPTKTVALRAAPDFNSAIANFSVCIYEDHLIVPFVDLRRGYYGFHVIAPNMEWTQCENADRFKSIQETIEVAKRMIDLDLAIEKAS